VKTLTKYPNWIIYCKRVKSKLYVGWVERQRNPTLSRVLLGFVPQPSLQASNRLEYRLLAEVRQQATGNRQQWEELEFFGIKLI
jgi:hypothetical protein